MRAWAALIFLILTACGEADAPTSEKLIPARPVSAIVSDTVVGTVQGAWAVAQMPFEDAGIKKQPIPAKLQQIADNPYALPVQVVCDGVRKEINELDALLGPDVCTPGQPTGPPGSRKGEYIEQGAGFTREQAVGIVRGKVDIIPFRGVVRKISGAEKHARDVERAYQAGRLRRAFLKGLAASLGPDCLTTLAK